MSSLSSFLHSADLAGQHFLKHPACGDLSSCLQHYHAHKASDASAVIGLSRQPNVSSHDAQLLQDHPNSVALFVPTSDDTEGGYDAHVYYASPQVIDSVCSVICSLDY